MSEFTKRALTGAAYVALTLGAAMIGPWTTFALFFPVCVIGAREWHRLYHVPDGSDPGEGRSMLLAGLSFIAIGLLPMSGSGSFAAMGSILAGLIVMAFDLMRRGVKHPAHAFAGYVATILYVSVPFSLVTWMVGRIGTSSSASCSFCGPATRAPTW